MWCSVINWLASRTVALAQVILPGCQGIPKSLADDVLKVRVHVGMRAQPVAKEMPSGCSEAGVCGARRGTISQQKKVHWPGF